MAEPIWILADVVSAIHQRQLAEHGGAEGIRNANALLSALSRSFNLLNYGEPKPDLAAVAASYAFGIARNHLFVDGNKRVALVVCRTFLRINGADISATQEEKYRTFLQLAEGRLTEEELADWLRVRLHEE